MLRLKIAGRIRRCWWRLIAAVASRLACLSNARLPLGMRGERAAVRFLRCLGYRVVDRNVRELAGEIDLIAVDERTVVFVEVKTRRSERYGRPAEAVDQGKRLRICRAAAVFAKRHRLTQCASRFDIVEVVWPDLARPPKITHLTNAFESELPG